MDPEAIDRRAVLLALERGLIDEAVLDTCAGEMAAAIDAGEPAPRVSQLLLRKGALDGATLAALLHEARGLPASEIMATVSDALRSESGPAGEHVGPYRVIREVAQGGMGVVFEALDTRLGRTVCLKLMKGSSETLRKRFEVEARSAGKLQHPSIVRMLALEEHEGHIVLVMDFAAGSPLSQYVAGEPPSVDWVLGFFDELLQAVAYMHAQGVLHRDLKPGNVIVTPEGRPRLIDFSLAKLADSEMSLTREGTPIGTPVYMPPEQITNTGTIDQRADVYALGVMLYELLTGRRPFDGDSATVIYGRILAATPTPAIELNPALPPALSAAVMRALSREPAARYPSAEAFRQALSTSSAPATVSRRPLIPVLIAAVALVVAVSWDGPVHPAGLLAAGRSRVALVDPRSAIRVEAARRLLARYQTSKSPRDLLDAARLDPGRAPVLREALVGWRDSKQDMALIEGLAVLLRHDALPDDEAAKWLGVMLRRSSGAADIDQDVARRAAALFRHERPEVAFAVEQRVYARIERAVKEQMSVHYLRSQMLELDFLSGVDLSHDGAGLELIRVARMRYRQFEYRQALGLLDFVNKVRPQRKNYWYFYTRGMVLQGLGRQAMAIADFERALAITPNQAAALHAGFSELRMGRHVNARKRFEAVVPKVQRSKSTTWLRACAIGTALCDVMARPDDKVAARRLGAAVDKGNPNFFGGLQFRYALAPWIWTRIVERIPGSATAQAGLGLTLKEHERADEAKAPLELALKLASENWRHTKAVKQALGR